MGPVLPELMVQTHSELETVAQSISMRGAGHAIGGIIGEPVNQNHKGITLLV